MVKYAWILGVAMAMTLCACTGGRSSNRDSGVMLMDGGPGTDAPLRDSGPRLDTGGGGGCTLGATGGLMGMCFPRCSAATATAVDACTTAACEQMAVAADTTASITLTIEGMSLTLDCQACFNVQFNTCIIEACPTEFNAYVACDDATPGMCMTQQTALSSCMTMQMATIQPCAQARVPLCFAGG